MNLERKKKEGKKKNEHTQELENRYKKVCARKKQRKKIEVERRWRFVFKGNGNRHEERRSTTTLREAVEKIGSLLRNLNKRTTILFVILRSCPIVLHCVCFLGD